MELPDSSVYSWLKPVGKTGLATTVSWRSSIGMFGPAAFITMMPGAVAEAELIGAMHNMEVALVTLQDPWRCMR